MLILIYLGTVGLAFGSFALAMIDRMKTGRDWVKGRSECDKCRHKLGVVDLFPVISWTSTKGRCRYCKTKLSKAYPLTELMCGLAFVVSFWFVPYDLAGINIVKFVIWLCAIVIMTALVVYDARWFKLPSKLVYPLVFLGLIHRIIEVLYNSESIGRDLIAVSLSLLVGSGLFMIIYLASSGKWIGDGDIRLGIAIGLFLPGPIESWLAIFVASVLGLIVGVTTTHKGTKIMTTKIPYGPMLIAGLFFVYLFGNQLIDWYSHTFLYL